MKSGVLIKDALILFSITLVCGLGLGITNEATKGTIEKRRIEKNLATYQAVYPEAVDFKADEALQREVDGFADTLALARESFGGVKIDSALNALSANGEVMGYVVSATIKGYADNITIAVGVTKEGEIRSIGFLEISETPGLGMEATNDNFKNQFNGKRVQRLEAVKTGASVENQVDAITGATITSTAVTEAVNGVLYFVNNCVEVDR